MRRSGKFRPQLIGLLRRQYDLGFQSCGRGRLGAGIETIGRWLQKSLLTCLAFRLFGGSAFRLFGGLPSGFALRLLPRLQGGLLTFGSQGSVQIGQSRMVRSNLTELRQIILGELKIRLADGCRSQVRVSVSDLFQFGARSAILGLQGHDWLVAR